MKTVDYINALRKLTDTGSDYAVAKLLGVTAQAMSQYVHKGRTMDNTRAARAAELLKLPPLDVIADMELERATTDEARAFWTKFRKGFGRRAAAVLLSILAAATMRANETDAQSLTADLGLVPTLASAYQAISATDDKLTIIRTNALLLTLLTLGLFRRRDRLQFNP